MAFSDYLTSALARVLYMTQYGERVYANCASCPISSECRYASLRFCCYPLLAS
jgi:hypothetical protein